MPSRDQHADIKGVLKYLHVEEKAEAGSVGMVDRKMETQCFADKKLELKNRLCRAFEHL